MIPNQEKIKTLLEQRAKNQARLKKIQTNTYQLAEAELGVIEEHLAQIENELKALGYKEKGT
ncbi:hypothetical protein COT65_00990 [Candidatus Shapirobacteria bacterium CG09_land_8_20_14_0_10_47_13]|uniref:Uncharacterized protein n=1 Tax=Candidatus Shapirobacteria bacterium CG09_land_8_20_14_0_10_47_13 TaxID=1974481 RepID=A0A2H0WN44_9BACT|nr:MAG: hypothetical protein COT65_00990 [Candidatus Shapirobacteria bacterium CG09_land_8_20_14_0_10_47_13]